VKVSANKSYEIKLFEEKYRETVSEHAYFACVSVLEEDYQHMFIVLKDNSYNGFGFIRVYDGYAEISGPFYISLPDDQTQIEILKLVLKGINKKYGDKDIYFFTDYPETFENLGCKIAYDAPSEILLKAVPT
jgi:hypothetical protein